MQACQTNLHIPIKRKSYSGMVLQEANMITVWNNGDGVPVEIHKDEKVYVPELIFGHLLTSSNYNDSQKKVSTTFSGL